MKSNVLLVALSAAVLASCGAANGASTEQTVLELTPTNYVTVTQTPTTLTADDGAWAGRATRARCTPKRAPTSSPPATIPSNIAVKYKVKLDDLIAINGWTLVERPGAGVQQSGARRDDQDPTGLDRARHRCRHHRDTGTTPSTETTTTIAGGQSACAPGEYTIVAGDYLGQGGQEASTPRSMRSTRPTSAPRATPASTSASRSRPRRRSNT